MTTDTLRDILAGNLTRIREFDSGGGGLLSVRAWAMKREVDVRLIDRLLKGEHAVKLDTLDEIARQLGLQPWQLLLPDFDPKSPQDMPMTAAERDMLQAVRRVLKTET